MKSVRHVGPRDNLLHIETEGGIVNIRVGLTDRQGRKVTSVEILPDRLVGDTWTLDGHFNNRLIEGEFEIPDYKAHFTALFRALAACEAPEGTQADDVLIEFQSSYDEAIGSLT